MSTRWCRGLMVLGVLSTAAACDGTQGYLAEKARRNRLEEIGVERFDSAGAYKLAGMSTVRDIDIEALRPEELGADTLRPAFHLLHMRCGTCHVTPAPGAKPAREWVAVMSRMKKNVQDAGLLPMTADEEAVVLGFLREHSADAGR